MRNSDSKSFRKMTTMALGASGLALATIAMVGASPENASAAECLLDTNDNGVADPADTDNGATSTSEDALACGENSEATGFESISTSRRRTPRAYGKRTKVSP
ncbi:hypothetical protein GCM10023208_03870 [Erythrobacter westpacificensis]|uniref:Uncharacterized protein n=1 Tax=Erythrobacter westpacificensis TaxID=1055231 RepID=A0ABP9JZW0_9SPHN